MRNSLLFLAITAFAVGGLSFSVGQPLSGMMQNAKAGPTTKSVAMPKRNSAENLQPVVLELFTSQGCSSCPPADAIAAKLDAEGRHLVISRPVTYWDRLGWKDTLALESNTTLQRAYSRQGYRGAGVYTPQIVVDGRHGAVGGREQAIRQLARDARGNDSAAIALRAQDDGGFAIGVNGTVSGTAEIMLLALDSHESVRIGRGENGGRTVSYTNVLRRETALADWNGGQQALAIPASRLTVAGADRFALIVREKNGGPILAARMVKDIG